MSKNEIKKQVNLIMFETKENAERLLSDCFPTKKISINIGVDNTTVHVGDESFVITGSS